MRRRRPDIIGDVGGQQGRIQPQTALGQGVGGMVAKEQQPAIVSSGYGLKGIFRHIAKL